MSKIRFIFVLLFVLGFLFVGSPRMTTAATDGMDIPAIVFVQDKKVGMMINHNFNFDGQIYIPDGTIIDSGFSVEVPSEGI